MGKTLTAQWFWKALWRPFENITARTMVLGGGLKNRQPGQWCCEVVRRSFGKNTANTMVSGGRLGKWLTVQWFSVVVLWSFGKVADSIAVFGVRFKKSQPGPWFLEVARPDSQTTSQNQCTGCSFSQTTSPNHGTVSHFFKRPATDLTKPMYVSVFSKRPPKTIVLSTKMATDFFCWRESERESMPT